jgi:DNA-binding CsgD family transcriptional regulator
MISLTPREVQYIAMLSAGLTVDEIRTRFELKDGSARSIFNRIRRKAGVETNTQLVAAFLSNKLTRSK